MKVNNIKTLSIFALLLSFYYHDWILIKIHVKMYSFLVAIDYNGLMQHGYIKSQTFKRGLSPTPYVGGIVADGRIRPHIGSKKRVRLNNANG